MPRRRRVPAPILVLVAVVALAAIAVAPRGLLRVVAAGEVPAHPVAAEPAIDAPGDDVDLPGVRALVAREEDDGHLVVAPDDVLPSTLAARATDADHGPVPAPSSAPIPLPDVPRSPHGDRAPPRPI